ncbi:MAG: GerW family sporulation protein [Oscillospiraceae bacterium]|nr:GerW family sporulation protein [Oscillospiraceae bacterium]MBQ2791637.1 GerW family sporulation protein [Oscillospiraceae bacterium]MBQ3241885.1 GerW family sporulation protein [Oscillospiraceae bacterium]MBQ7082336.1 GerW family sporulation protein [Oscillospiraceae bacterium]MBR2635828.1 GerW family sporulation protein [Oscillospiraceae bacterium]
MSANLEGLLNISLDKLKGLVDVNTIIGEPITVPDGTIIIPVSKVSFGYGSGGSDFGGNKPKDLFGGGSGAGVSIQPLAFLVIQNGNVKLMQMQSYHSSTERAVGMVPELVDKFAAMFSKEKKAPAEDQTV